MSERTRAIAFVGSVVPERMLTDLPASSVAGNKFQLQLIGALGSCSGCVPKVISVLPIASYPGASTIIVRSLHVRAEDETKIDLIPFVNVVIWKQVTICLSIFCFLVSWLWRTRSQPRVVLVYNVYAPMSLPILLAVKLMGGKSIAVVPDLPHNLDFSFRGIWGGFQRMNFAAETWSLAHFDGLMPTTRWVAEDFAPHRPSLILEGGVVLSDLDPVDDSFATTISGRTGEKICLYSGNLSAINGIELLIQAFLRISCPTYRLWVFGSGILESLVREASVRDPRITYWGFMPNSLVMQYQRRATVLINPRPTAQLVTRYTFPSKVMEYMLSGRPVITTALGGIPAEYFPFVFIVPNETPETLACMIQDICARQESALAEFGRRAQRFVMDNKNWERQGRRAYEFICSV